MKLIYPDKFKIPNNLVINYEDYKNLSDFPQLKADKILKACKFSGHIAMIHTTKTGQMKQTYKFDFTKLWGWIE